MDEYNMNQPQQYDQDPGQGGTPGKGKAIACMVVGICSACCICFGYGAILGVITGIVALVLASKAKAEGYEGGFRKAGFICGLIGLIGSAIVFVSCIACVGAITAAGAAGVFDELLDML